ncbi:chorismate mutase [Streptomyces nigra]|uniref:chorismate mutase n=1 Tax=Streptomyces nigra TaxID=1827580 RepID=UPI0037F2E2E3
MSIRDQVREQLKCSDTVRRHTLLCALMGAAVTLGAPGALAVTGSSQTDTGKVSTASVKPLGPLGPLTALVIERLLVSDQVAASKFGIGRPIDDPARERQVLEEVKLQAGSLGLDPDATVSFFRDQITASKVVQKGLFVRWTAHPDEAPTTRPDLTQIRTQLDQITAELLQELKATRNLRESALSCNLQLALATQSGIAVNGLDRLHRQALRGATDSVCVTSTGDQHL